MWEIFLGDKELALISLREEDEIHFISIVSANFCYNDWEGNILPG